MYDCRYSGSICLLEYHHIHIQHSQLHLPQSNVISMSPLYFPATLCTDQYILVWTYSIQVHTHHDPVHTSFQSLTGTISFATRASLLPPLVRWFAGIFLLLFSFLYCQSTYARLATSKLPQPWVDLVDVTTAPAILCSSVCTTSRETWSLVLAVPVRDCRGRVPIQMAGHQGDSTHHVLCRSHVEAWCWGWFIKLDHPSIFHGSFDGQRKLLKGAEENQEERDIVRASLVAACLRQSAALWAQVAAEEELGPYSPTVFQGNIMAIFLNAVRKWRNNQNSILCRSSATISFLVYCCTYS